MSQQYLNMPVSGVRFCEGSCISVEGQKKFTFSSLEANESPFTVFQVLECFHVLFFEVLDFEHNECCPLMFSKFLIVKVFESK